MKNRGTALVVALLVAAGATAAVFLYVQSVKKNAAQPTAVTVIVSKNDITAGTKLDPLINGGQFTTLQVPTDAVVPGAVTDLSQLRGKLTSSFILQGEQISTARLQGSTYNTGGVLGIQKGHEGLTVQLQAQAVPAQIIQPGDHVTLYATFSDVSVIRGTTLNSFLKGKAVTPDNTKAEIGDFTVTLVPNAKVLKVGGESGSSTTGTTSDIMVTLELTPTDAQQTVFAQEKGSLWLGLLPPGTNGQPLPPLNAGQILIRSAVKAQVR
jgi:pilus assembly protein CpaB